MGVPARWNREAVLQESYLVRPHSRTLFEGIYTVPPGHYAIAQGSEVSLYPYWDLDFPTATELAADDRSDEEVVAGFREALEDAVRERLVADAAGRLVVGSEHAQGALGGGETGDRHAVGRRAHVVQPQRVAELDAAGITTMLTADPQLEVRSARSAVLAGHPNEFPDAVDIE